MVFQYVGEVALTPDVDEWKDITRRPDLIVNDNSLFDSMTALAGNTNNLGTLMMADLLLLGLRIEQMEIIGEFLLELITLRGLHQVMNLMLIPLLLITKIVLLLQV